MEYVYLSALLVFLISSYDHTLFAKCDDISVIYKLFCDSLSVI